MFDERLLKKQILDSTNDKLISDRCSEVKRQYLMMKSSSPSLSKRKKMIISFTIPSFVVVALTLVLVAFVTNQKDSTPSIGYTFLGKEEAIQVSLVTVSNVISNQDSTLESQGLLSNNQILINDEVKGETPPPPYPWDDNGPSPLVQDVFAKINSYANTSEIILRDQLPVINAVKSDRTEYQYEVITTSMSLYYNEEKSDTAYSMNGLIVKEAGTYIVTGSKDLSDDSDMTFSVIMSSTYTINMTNHSNDNAFITCDYEIINSSTQVTSTYQLVESNETIGNDLKPCVSLLYRPNIAKSYQNDFTFYINDDDQLAGSYSLSFEDAESGDEWGWGLEGDFYGDYDEYGDYCMHGDINQFFQDCPPDGDPDWHPSPDEYDWNMDYGEPRCQGPQCDEPRP